MVSQLVGNGKAIAVAKTLAAQTAKYDAHTTAVAKQFLKPIPKDRLEQERERFVRLFAEPTVLEALTTFVENTDVRPYLI